MPSRKPIIPGLTRSSHVLKPLHLEMQQRKLLSNTSTSSGIYSNSDISEQEELLRKQKVEYLTHKMGKTQEAGKDTCYGDDRTEKENESDSSGPDDDGDDDDVTDDDEDNTENDQNFEEEVSDASDADEDDERYEKEKTIRVNDDIAWEQANRGIAKNVERPQRYIGDQKLAQFSASHQKTSIAEARMRTATQRSTGPTSYVRLVKETEDEIELIRRMHGNRNRQEMQQLPPEQQKGLKAKRRSTNAITFLYGRRKEKPIASAETEKRHSLDASTKRQQREHANSRECEVNAHLQRIQGGRISFQPIRTPRFHDRHTANTSRELVLASAMPCPKPRGVRNGYNSDESELVFPLRDMAAGESENQIGVRKARTLETAAKRRTKARKNELAIAKLDVTETRLVEFSATLRARQAKIEEGQAKLCRRRAALKEAEEELDALESKMDAEEEDHRARERRIKNRERRVRQEEAGLALKEESLRKREVAITKGIEQIERRRKLVEEKEGMQKSMEEIMLKKEELHGRDMTHMNKTGKAGILGKLLKKSGRDRTDQIEPRRASAGNPSTYTAPNIRSTKSSSEYVSYNADINDGRRLSNGNEKIRTNSGIAINSQPKGEPKTSTLSRSEGKSKTMGLWI